MIDFRVDGVEIALWVIERTYTPIKSLEFTRLAKSRVSWSASEVAGYILPILRLLERQGLVTVRHHQWRTTAAGWLWRKLQLSTPTPKSLSIITTLETDDSFSAWSYDLVLKGASRLSPAFATKIGDTLFCGYGNPLYELGSIG